MDRGLVKLGVTERFLYGLQGATEEISTQLLKTSPGDVGVEVDALVERVDLDAGLGAAGQSTLRALTGGAETAHGALVVGNVLLELALELLYKVVDHPVVEVLSSQVGVTGSGLDFKDTVFDGQDGHVKGAAAQIKDQDVALAADLLVKAIGNSRSCGLVDDTEHVETSDCSSVFCSLPLGVIEVGRYGYYSVLYSLQ